MRPASEGLNNAFEIIKAQRDKIRALLAGVEPTSTRPSKELKDRVHMLHEAVEADVGKKIRRFFFIGTSIGSILTVYCRAITTRQMSEGLCFTESRFSKPYFFALMMATGMSFGLIVDKIQRMCNKEQVIFTTSQLTFRHFLLILLCALCDLYIG